MISLDPLAKNKKISPRRNCFQIKMKIHKKLSNPSIQLLLFLIGFWTVTFKTKYRLLKPLVFRSSRPDVFLRKDVLKMWSKFTGKHSCRSLTSVTFQSNKIKKIKIRKNQLLSNFIEITLRHGHERSPVNLQHIFRTRFLNNTSGRLLLNIRGFCGPHPCLKSCTVQNPIRNRSSCIDGFERFLYTFIFSGSNFYVLIFSYLYFLDFITLQLYWNCTRHECSSVKLLHIFRTPFFKNTSGRLFLNIFIQISDI